MKRHSICALLLLCVAVNAGAALNVSVDETGVNVSGVARGGSVVLFSCMRVQRTRAIGVKPEAVSLRDDDNDGTIRYAPKDGVPLRSVWIAVDQSSGEAAPAARADFPLLVSPIGDGDFKKDVEGEIASMGQELMRFSMLLVRPGSGAWTLTGFDGEKSDRDGIGDGRVKLAFEDAQTVFGKDKAPKHLKKGDTVVVIDPGHLDVFLSTIDK
jgi:hypothetical protein